MNIQLYILNFSALRALHEKSFYFLIEKVIDELLTTTFQAHLLGLLGKTGLFALMLTTHTNHRVAKLPTMKIDEYNKRGRLTS